MIFKRKLLLLFVMKSVFSSMPDGGGKKSILQEAMSYGKDNPGKTVMGLAGVGFMLYGSLKIKGIFDKNKKLEAQNKEVEREIFKSCNKEVEREIFKSRNKEVEREIFKIRIMKDIEKYVEIFDPSGFEAYLDSLNEE